MRFAEAEASRDSSNSSPVTLSSASSSIASFARVQQAQPGRISLTTVSVHRSCDLFAFREAASRQSVRDNESQQRVDLRRLARSSQRIEAVVRVKQHRS